MDSINQKTGNFDRSRYHVLINAQRGIGENGVSAAIITLFQFSSERTTSWPTIFSWAHPPKKLRSRYEEFLKKPLCRKDKLQIQKDLPRTRGWLYCKRKSESASEKQEDVVEEEEAGETNSETKTTTELEKQVRIQEQKLERVLHAFVTSMYVGEDDDQDDERDGAYVQGMNGIAFVLLDVLNGNEKDAFTYLRGICTNLLPGLFHGTGDDILGQDNLTRMAQYFEKLLREFYPVACEKCNRGGMPVGTLALKWMLTLFSNLSFSGGDDTLQYTTILAAWDICFFMGMAGVTAVVLALFGFAAPKLANVKDDPAMIEDIINILSISLRRLPDSMLYNQCAELLMEDSIHPKLRILREAHEKKVKQVRIKLRRKLSYEYESNPQVNGFKSLNSTKLPSNGWMKPKNRIHPESHVYDGKPSRYENPFTREETESRDVESKFSSIKENNYMGEVDESKKLPHSPIDKTDIFEAVRVDIVHQNQKNNKKKIKKKKSRKLKNKETAKEFKPSTGYVEEWYNLRNVDDQHQYEISNSIQSPSNQLDSKIHISTRDKKSSDELEFPGFAHDWIETWDDETNSVYYYNTQDFSKKSWFPPPQGYISMSGLLLLGNGQLAEYSSSHIPEHID